MFSTQDMHHIQKDIILNLASSSPLRFSQLQPTGVPNNTFSYHLKKLLESGYIIATEQGYVDTRKALKTIQYDSGQKKRTTAPALITVIYITSDDGKVLLLKRKNRPFAEWYGIPSGLMHKGETLQSAAQRELFEKTGIQTLQTLEFVGVLDFKYLEPDSGDLFVHAVSFVYRYVYHKPSNQLSDRNTKYGELFWSDLSHERILPEVYAIANLVRDGSASVSSIDFEEPVMTLR